MDAVRAPLDLWTFLVLSVEENTWEVWKDGVVSRVRCAPIFPGPRVERVSPGHLVAIAPGPTAGLPGADWWVAGPVGSPAPRIVDLDEVARFYTEHGLWAAALDVSP
ncbi:hypothetical protein [Oerskovia jenensis]|uniref:hypothetical protein n=1 Tax=Oerskovia jenensis TaxID=162169 RepID=UPI0036DB2F42